MLNIITSKQLLSEVETVTRQLHSALSSLWNKGRALLKIEAFICTAEVYMRCLMHDTAHVHITYI